MNRPHPGPEERGKLRMGIDQIIAKAVEMLWIGGLAATPLAIVVSLICRARRVRPATRHMLWFAVLASFITPAAASLIWRPQWFRSDRVMAAAGSVLEEPVHSVPDSVTPAPVTPLDVVVGGGELVGPPLIRSDEPRGVTSAGSSWAGPVAPQVRGWLPAIDSPVERRSVVDAPVRVEPVEFVGPLPVRTTKAHHEKPSMVSAAPRVESAVTTRPIAAKPAPASETAATSVSPPAVVSPPAEPIKAARTEPSPARAWLERALNVRDALAALPPIPPAVWFGGALLIVVLSVWRRCMGMLWLRNATPAGPHVQAVVRQVADALGLSRTPRVVFVDDAVSPMIWCGLRPVLVLPTSLWRTLDEDSRRAVLVHELAHVRRWDHLLCWLEAGIGALYWWHPVVWWVRRRVHEEAEASCDTWVTSLFPSQRRAYASALLVTKSFVSSRAASRGPWLGVASGSAKRLARRITMVMTHKSAPRMSMLGVFVTTLIVATGAFVMPGLACPPEDEAKAKAKAEQLAKARARTPRASSGEAGPTFFGEAPALEAMRGGGVGVAVPVPPQPAQAPRAPKPPKAPKAPKPPTPPAAALAPVAPFAAPQTVATLDLESLKEGREPREYHLGQGKLQAFYGMMSRNDVPILVQMQGDKIIIWGNDDEHAVFSKFVKIVDGATGQSRVIAPGRVAVQGQLDAERLAAIAGQQGRAAAAHKAAADEYRESVRALTLDRAGEERAARTRVEGNAQADRARARKATEEAAQASRERATADRAESRALEAQIRALEAQIRDLEERAEKLSEDREEGKSRRRPASPGMMAPAAPGTPAASPCEGSGECEKTCESTTQTASR